MDTCSKCMMLYALYIETVFGLKHTVREHTSHSQGNTTRSS